MKEKARIEETIGRLESAGAALEDAQVLFDLAREEGDESQYGEVGAHLDEAERRVEALEFQRMLSGADDPRNAILTINAGAGGVDAQDWAEMLLRMYLRYAESHGWEAELLDRQDGEEAGIKSATVLIKGEYAYGYLKAEKGVHRLVRISPFDAAGRRHTAFASVYVAPEVDDDIEVEIDENDVRVDVFRASGAGGQHVNKTNSAVRLTHVPTGIVVSCQAERSQHKNRDRAWKMLRSRLYELELQRREEERARLEGTKSEISFGSQIRSYVLAPYQMVKDHRTGIETGNVQKVLDGDLDEFVVGFLLGKGSPEAAAGATEEARA